MRRACALTTAGTSRTLAVEASSGICKVFEEYEGAGAGEKKIATI
jgi:hypothetical protein